MFLEGTFGDVFGRFECSSDETSSEWGVGEDRDLVLGRPFDGVFDLLLV